MMDTKELLKRISALRQRLDQTRDPVGGVAATLQEADAFADDPIQVLQRKIETGSWETALLDDCMRRLPDMPRPGEQELLPPLLTSRGVRLLKRGKELLQELRELVEGPIFLEAAQEPATSSAETPPTEPLVALHRELVAVTDSVLRTVQAFPAAPSAQMRLCEGLEIILALVDEKLGVLRCGLQLKKKERRRIDFLAEVLENVLLGSSSGLTALHPLAVEIVSEVHQGMALRFLHAPPTEPARFTAAHSLTVAEVLARVLVQDGQWRDRLEEAVLVAFFHDIGMLKVPADVLAKPEALEAEERRVVERHVVLSHETAMRLWPADSPAAQAIRDHHERNDGTGYPTGKKDAYLTPLAKLLAACDVYAALCSPRPHRRALDTRTALTDTLLLADQGILDRTQADRVLALSFHPVGSVVELSDGAWASVVAVHPRDSERFHPAKPIVGLLTDPQGFPLPIPRILDLALDEHRSIVRNLPGDERRGFMLKRYPDLA